MSETTEWLIWSNEHMAYWKPNRRGYTTWKNEVGRYSYEEAVEIVKGANFHNAGAPNETMMPL